jgi:hypothetical protein
MSGQSTNHVLLIRPVEFYSNQQTIETNHYQSVDDDKPHSEILEDALIEFDNFENNLLENNIKVTTLKGQKGCPDNIFPNWAVTYDDQSMHLFSMLSENRRLEKSDEHIAFLNKQYRTTLDYSPYENQSWFLEGTSSLVLDRVNRKAYMGISARSNEELAIKWAKEQNYELIVFETQSHSGDPIYHSDVLMYIGTELAVVCSEAIKVGANNVINELSHTHRILDISSQQLLDFCGNCIEIKDTNNNLNLIMSTLAFEGYDSSQLNVLNEHFTKIIYSDLKTIEKYGGGSARCMIMELY